MKNLTSEKIPGYTLLDSGHGKKLEVIAGVTIERPSPQAIWAPRLDESQWKKATSVCIRKSDGGGTWQHRSDKEPHNLVIKWNTAEEKKLQFKLKFTSLVIAEFFLNKRLFGTRWLKKQQDCRLNWVVP